MDSAAAKFGGDSRCAWLLVVTVVLERLIDIIFSWCCATGFRLLAAFVLSSSEAIISLVGGKFPLCCCFHSWPMILDMAWDIIKIEKHIARAKTSQMLLMFLFIFFAMVSVM